LCVFVCVLMCACVRAKVRVCVSECPGYNVLYVKTWQFFNSWFRRTVY